MRKFKISLASLFLALGIISCNNQESTNSNEAEEKVCKYVYKADDTKIGFGAFKFTEKVEVKGGFEDFKIENTVASENPNEVFANAEFTVYVKSLETNDEGRNIKIREHFFGTMLNTDEMKGYVTKIENDSIYIDFKMNELTKSVALSYSLDDKNINLEGTINVLDWSANEALAAINKACEDLHKGEDGISKTWADVNLYISTTLAEDCK